MPLMYLVGLVQFVLQYWMDKWLFLRFYKTPPRYGLEMLNISRTLLLYAIVIHYAFGVYMLSNSQILTVTGWDLGQWVDAAVDMGMEQVASNSYISRERLQQTHVVIYLLGFGLYLVVLLVTVVCVWLC